MKRAVLFAALIIVAAACKPNILPPPPVSTQILYVEVNAAEVGGKDGGYMNGQGDVLGVPGFEHCHTAPDRGWTNNESTQCQVDIPTGTTLTLTAVPDDATSTAYIGGDCTEQTATTCTVKMDGIRRIYGTFFPVALTVTTNCWPESLCAVASEADSYNEADGGIRIDFYDHYTDYSRRMTPGSIAIISAHANLGYHLTWGGPCADIVFNDTCTVTINEAARVSIYAMGPQPE